MHNRRNRSNLNLNPVKFAPYNGNLNLILNSGVEDNLMASILDCQHRGLGFKSLQNIMLLHDLSSTGASYQTQLAVITSTGHKLIDCNIS